MNSSGSSSEPSSTVDLGRGGLPLKWAAEIRGATSAKTSSIFAVTGPWGSGKSWLLAPLMRELVPEEASQAGSKDVVVEFNPWLFADERALFHGFSSMLLDGKNTDKKARKVVAKSLQLLGSSISIGTSALPISVSLESVANAAAEKISPVASPASLRKSISDALRLDGGRVFVVMDDLDRLTPEELLTLFKLIRLLGDIPGLQYVLAYDQETVLHLLDETPIARGSALRAERYLEKIVERRFIVPPLTERQVQALVVDPMAEFVQQFDTDLRDQQAVLVQFRLAPFLFRHIGTPRAAERLLDAVRRLSPEMAAEIRLEHWCIVAFLRTFFPRVWELIVSERDLMTGIAREIVPSREKALQGHAARILAQMTDLLASVPDAEALIELIRHIFPAFDKLAAGRSIQEWDSRRAASERGVGHPEFVERYLWDELPPGLISEGRVRSLVKRLPDEEAIDLLADLVEHSKLSALEAIARSADATQPATMVMLLENLHGRYGPKFGERDPGLLRGVIEQQATALLPRLHTEELRQIHNPESESAIDRPLLRAVLTSQQVEYLPPGDLKVWVEVSRAKLQSSLQAELTEAPTPSIDLREVRELILDLLRLSPNEARATIKSALDAGRWRADDIASIYALTYRGDDGPIVAGIAMDQLRRDLGNDLVHRLSEDEGLGGFPDEWVGDGPGRDIALPITIDNARMIAAYCLKVYGVEPDENA